MTLWLSDGTCSYVCVYIYVVAKSVMLYLRHDFYAIIFKIKHKLHIATGSAPPKENFWVRTWICALNENRPSGYPGNLRTFTNITEWSLMHAHSPL
jgi:hypothetical protein